MKKIMVGSLAFQDFDFTHDLDIHSHDEMGEIAQAFNIVAEGLWNLLKSMKHSSSELSIRFGNIDTNMTSLSLSTESTLDSTSDITAVIEETYASAQGVSVTVSEIKDALNSVAERTVEGADSSTEKI